MRQTHLLLALLATVACESTAPVAPADGPVPLVRLRAEATAYNSNTTLDSAESGSVLTQIKWHSLYGKIWASFSAPPPAPTFNFQDSMLVYVAMGFYPNASHRILLDSAEFDSGALVIHFTQHADSGCGVASVAVSPVDVAQVPRWTGDIQFVRNDVTVDCS